jgi:hypothetical protein
MGVKVYASAILFYEPVTYAELNEMVFRPEEHSDDEISSPPPAPAATTGSAGSGGVPPPSFPTTFGSRESTPRKPGRTVWAGGMPSWMMEMKGE